MYFLKYTFVLKKKKKYLAKSYQAFNVLDLRYQGNNIHVWRYDICIYFNRYLDSSVPVSQIPRGVPQ